ncbi:MAG: membrane protein insertion efficiency factor YidD [Desulfobacteraceae bacterium]
MNRQVKVLLFFLFFAFLAGTDLFVGIAWGDEPFRSHTADERPGFNLGMWLVDLYSNTISTVDADRCPSVPSCSQYSLEAFKKHGFFTGWIMTVDRLIHEGNEEARVSPVVHSGGKWKIFDPVENNDFWWHPRKWEHHD